MTENQLPIQPEGFDPFSDIDFSSNDSAETDPRVFSTEDELAQRIIALNQSVPDETHAIESPREPRVIQSFVENVGTPASPIWETFHTPPQGMSADQKAALAETVIFTEQTDTSGLKGTRRVCTVTNDHLIESKRFSARQVGGGADKSVLLLLDKNTHEGWVLYHSRPNTEGVGGSPLASVIATNIRCTLVSGRLSQPLVLVNFSPYTPADFPEGLVDSRITFHEYLPEIYPTLAEFSIFPPGWRAERSGISKAGQLLLHAIGKLFPGAIISLIQRLALNELRHDPTINRAEASTDNFPIVVYNAQPPGTAGKDFIPFLGFIWTTENGKRQLKHQTKFAAPVMIENIFR